MLIDQTIDIRRIITTPTNAISRQQEMDSSHEQYTHKKKNECEGGRVGERIKQQEEEVGKRKNGEEKKKNESTQLVSKKETDKFGRNIVKLRIDDIHGTHPKGNS